jgi:hypothetical protein
LTVLNAPAAPVAKSERVSFRLKRSPRVAFFFL